jgi:uncharacterized protein YybS (DUF2232 family)
MWSGIFILLLLSVLTPFSVITLSLIVVPILMLYVTLNMRAFVVYFTISLIVFILLLGQFGISLILISLFFLGPAVVMGHLYKKESAAHAAIAAGVITLIAEILILFLIAALFSVNVVGEAARFIEESFLTLPEGIRNEVPEEFMDQAIVMMTQMIPLYMILFSVYYAVITHWIGRMLLNRSGYKVKKLPPVKDWMVPRSLVWYYMVALLLSYFVESEAGSMMTMILLNLVPLLMYVFCVQAVSFLFFLADFKKWNKTLPILAIIVSIFLPTMISLLGVFDIMFDLRKKMKQKKE